MVYNILFNTFDARGPALIWQLFFRDDYIWYYETSTERRVAVDLCASTAECFMNSFYLGLNYGGLAQGLTDIRDKWEYDPTTSRIRWIVDLMFYISVIVMLLNIIFGAVLGDSDIPFSDLS